MFTYPPSGIALMAYKVSLPFFLKIAGPNPIAKSVTLILHNFAIKKWPHSCIKIIKPNKTIIFIAPIKNAIILPPTPLVILIKSMQMEI